MKGELFLPGSDKPAAVLDCKIAEYRKPGDPDHSIRITYTYREQGKKMIELYKDTPLRLRLEDGREATVRLQYQSITPDGRVIGVLRVIGE